MQCHHCGRSNSDFKRLFTCWTHTARPIGWPQSFVKDRSANSVLQIERGQLNREERMKLIPESIKQTDLSHSRCAAQTGQYRPKSQPASLTPAPRADQRRVFWLFIFSFSLVLVYGGCAKTAGLRRVKTKAEKGAVAYAISRTQLDKPANQVSPGLATPIQRPL